MCRLAVEEQVNFAAKTKVLRSLANVEAELGVALAGVAAVKLHDAILQGQAAERLGERLGIVYRQAKPSIGDLALWRTGMGVGVWAAGAKFGSDPGLVADFDEEVAPALLDQLPLSRAGVHLDTRLGVDVDIQEALSVKNLLHFGNGIGGVCLAKCLIESFLHLR